MPVKIFATFSTSTASGLHEPQGNCWDNAVTETLFGSLKVERLHGERFKSIRQAKDAVLAWLLWYNRQRMHSTLNYLSPWSSKTAGRSKFLAAA